MVKINYTEIAQYQNQNKDSIKFAIEKLIRIFEDKSRNGSIVGMEIPGVGSFHVKNGIAGIKF